MIFQKGEKVRISDSGWRYPVWNIKCEEVGLENNYRKFENSGIDFTYEIVNHFEHPNSKVIVYVITSKEGCSTVIGEKGLKIPCILSMDYGKI